MTRETSPTTVYHHKPIGSSIKAVPSSRVLPMVTPWPDDSLFLTQPSLRKQSDELDRVGLMIRIQAFEASFPAKI